MFQEVDGLPTVKSTLGEPNTQQVQSDGTGPSKDGYEAWDLSAAPVQRQPDRSLAVTDEC
ncbi:uncharacterized protein N7515_001941 [Penicillium bovifimosum]|uniref:Uncharacterized protein n=1 Tax=Penicillium bovifimosum TaxID=126998 RepID=A0A9W9HAP2_9EURO|nr:uncharacterized protein N7515_001941 [Penicillium bovifimosum]KAJ5143154.1 hypothetical protein N7515_001941 [Penicillium bovifimosum]